MRFLEDAELAAGFEGLPGSVDEGGFVASLAEERVVLDDMRNCANFPGGCIRADLRNQGKWKGASPHSRQSEQRSRDLTELMLVE